MDSLTGGTSAGKRYNLQRVVKLGDTMNKVIGILFALVSLPALACWFTEEDFNNNYIAGANNYVAHYTQVVSINDAVYYNGMEVAMPITLFVKVSPRDGTASTKITRAVLQYKILPNGTWVTVKQITKLSDLDFNKPVILFGKNSINIPKTSIAANTEILIRVYLTDGVYETGDLDEDVTQAVPDQVTDGNYDFGGGWTAPFLFRVKYNGKRRPIN